MKKNLGVIILAALALIALAAGTVAFAVPSWKTVVVKRFGETIKVLEGKDQAGLHGKWIYPIESIVAYDGRIDVFEGASKEFQTRDKQNVMVTTYCLWRIKDAQKFQSTIKTFENGRNRIRILLSGVEKDVISHYEMREYVNTDPSEMKLVEIESKMLAGLKDKTEADYGVEIVQVGIKGLTLGAVPSQAVIAAMKEERQKEVARFKAMGKAQAEAIKSRAERASKQIISFANGKAKAIRTGGYSDAAKQYEMFRANPQLGIFLRYLETLRSGLRENTTIWLDGSKIPAVKYFLDGPKLPAKPKLPTAEK